MNDEPDDEGTDPGVTTDNPGFAGDTVSLASELDAGFGGDTVSLGGEPGFGAVVGDTGSLGGEAVAGFAGDTVSLTGDTVFALAGFEELDEEGTDPGDDGERTDPGLEIT